MPFIIPVAIIVTSSAPGNVLSSVTLRQQAVPAKKNNPCVADTFQSLSAVFFLSSTVCGGHASLLLSFPGVQSVQVKEKDHRMANDREVTDKNVTMIV